MVPEAVKQFFQNLKHLPANFVESFCRHGKPTSTRVRSQVVFGNVFFHIHSVRVHRYSLKPFFTCGLGIIAASSFIILCVTGIALMVYYKPSVEAAYASVKEIQYVVPSGRFLRNAHRWATNIMLVSVFLHMARVFYTAAYKRGRAFNWLVGMALFVLTLGLSFTGYLLPWDQLAYWATTIGSNIAASFRELTDVLHITRVVDPGGAMKTLLLGGHEIGQEALSRFYWIHCIIFPVMLMIILAVHFWRIRKDGGLVRPDRISEAELEGIPTDNYADSTFDNAPEKTYGLMAIVKGNSPAVGRGPEQTIQSWPTVFKAETALFLLTFALTSILAYCFNAPLKEIANPAVPENPAKAPWYFLGVQELVSYSAFVGGVVIPSIALIGLALIPYLDREDQEVGRWCDTVYGRKIALRSAFFAALTTLGLLTLLVGFGWLRDWFPGINQGLIMLVNPGVLLVLLFVGWSITIMSRHKSTRLAAIALFTCFLVGFIILTYFATYHRGPNWNFYWMKSQWPVH